jgi:hypothetical protein
MFLEELFAWIKKCGSRSIQLGAKEEGVAIKRRLQELLDLFASAASMRHA